MKERIAGIVSLVFLFIAYFVFRYALFDWHGMIEWPLDLLIVGIIVIAISGIVKGNKIVPVFTAAGYIIGFFSGHAFSVDYIVHGDELGSTGWQIWTCVYVAAMIAGVLVEAIRRKKHKEQ